MHLNVVLLLLPLLHTLSAEDCARFYPSTYDPFTFVCECSATRCPTPVDPPLFSDLTSSPPIAFLYRTSIEGDRLTRHTLNITTSRSTRKGSSANDVTARAIRLTLDRSKTFQKIIGFGGAITDAAAINIDLLNDEETREHLLAAYFAQDGIGYTLARIPIGSCDFSTHEYSYADLDGDFALSGFALAPEDWRKIACTKRAIELAGDAGHKLKVFGSPWSAPAWMKTNGHMKGGGSLKPGAQFEKTWANYFVKFIEAYTAAGIPIWAVTTQNEPSTGEDPDYSFQTMYLSPEEQQHFVRDLLHPAFSASRAARDTQIMIFDDFRGNLPRWADVTLNCSKAAATIAGIAVHWYGDGAPPDNLDKTHAAHPDHFILGTEACVTDTHGVTLGNFTRGMMYAKDIVQDLNHFVTGWVDWNIALDLQGGPNWVANFVDSPIIVDAAKQTFYKQPMFYAMGQFSRFLSPGAVRIALNPEQKMADVDTVAFRNPSGTIAVVLLNRGETPVEVEIVDGKKRIPLTLAKQSINTVVYVE